MSVVRRVAVSLDCADAGVLAEFWARLLGGTVAFTSPATGAAGVVADGFVLTAMPIADYQPPTWPEPGVPKQIHLDLAVEDLAAAQAEALRFGATLAATQPDPDRRRVLLDPAGHPFCLTAAFPAALR
ncbi:VOC family protein [Frankia sp. AgB32]|uniref:VOC family protein n=1 Tax=Frankia sp. AgB32 TaxID=631119 RepID=UPI00200ECBCE|nr:VOC family protein [Frankia sp. AgB32]MCK9898333.1 VOC family protein [Frankia sp. AgB32]